MRRRLVLALAIGLPVLGVAGVYAYNVYRNLEAQHDVRESCATIRDDVRMRLHPRLLGAVLSPDEARGLRADFLAGHDEMCGFLDRELVWWRWNWGRKVKIPQDPARQGRTLRRVTEMRRRVPGLMRESMRFLGTPPDQVDRAVAQMTKRADASLAKLSAPRTARAVELWTWARTLRQTADAIEAGAAEHAPAKRAP